MTSCLVCRMKLQHAPASPFRPPRQSSGNRLFGWETGLPTGYWLKSREMNPLIMMPYHFSMTGQPAPHIYIGKKSGAANVTLVNERLGLAQIEDKDKVKELLHKVRSCRFRSSVI